MEVLYPNTNTKARDTVDDILGFCNNFKREFVDPDDMTVIHKLY